MRRTAVIAGSVVTALATTAVLAVSGGAQEPGGRTIKLVTKDFRFGFVDNPPRQRSRNSPPGTGDTFTLSGSAVSTTGARLGSVDASCTVTRGGRRARTICHGIYVLRDGEIHLLARLGPTDNVKGSVIGGTDAYAGARGTFTSIDRRGEAGGDPSDDTITLLP